MQNRIKDQVCVVTGATGGIGGAIAEALAAQGAKLVLAARSAEKLAPVEAAIKGSGASVVGVVGDLTREADAEALIAKAVEAYGRVDTLFNVPGLSVPGPIAETSVEDFQRMLDVNVKSAFLLTKHFLKRVDGEKGGLIVNVSSVAGKTANPNAPLYCMAKAALNMLGSGTALQAKAANVRVTTLSPGATTTPGFWGSRPVPHEKFMKPADVAEVAVYLAGLPESMVVHDVVFEPFAMFKGK